MSEYSAWINGVNQVNIPGMNFSVKAYSLETVNNKKSEGDAIERPETYFCAVGGG